ncbi:unknown protein [Desulfotalea psychrophila LSv54]|uniref:Uncharacterized protein n=1 Tax=Desulfotalea psychrophila (strain LSv54 / DSM 12343) TaxID=177439 RepID=Q6AJ96_DESPS|nr:unknown protein [Desulfotalea psychrophila LSv54]
MVFAGSCKGCRSNKMVFADPCKGHFIDLGLCELLQEGDRTKLYSAVKSLQHCLSPLCLSVLNCFCHFELMMYQ